MLFGDRLLALVHHGFMNFVTTTSPNFGSGMISRFSAGDGGTCLTLRDLRRYFGRFAPYFERRCLRFLTPCVSSTPRRMW